MQLPDKEHKIKENIQIGLHIQYSNIHQQFHGLQCPSEWVYDAHSCATEHLDKIPDIDACEQ